MLPIWRTSTLLLLPQDHFYRVSTRMDLRTEASRTHLLCFYSCPPAKPSLFSKLAGQISLFWCLGSRSWRQRVGRHQLLARSSERLRIRLCPQLLDHEPAGHGLEKMPGTVVVRRFAQQRGVLSVLDRTTAVANTIPSFVAGSLG